MTTDTTQNFPHQAQYGPWTVQNTTEKYQNAFMEVFEDQVLRPDGTSGCYATVTMKPGVAVLPIDAEGTVYLTKQFRYALGNDSIEVVCGGIDGEKSPLDAAQQELQEELGIEAAEWVDLGVVDLDTSIVRCPVYLFLAKQLTFQPSHPEPTEVIESVRMPLSVALNMVLQSQITHAPSCVLLLKSRDRI